MRRQIRNTSINGLITRRQGAIAIGMSQHKLTNLVHRSNRFDCPETLTKKGRVMYKLSDLEAWKEKNMDLFDGGYFLEAVEWTMPPSTMMLIKWADVTKHVSAYAAKLRHTAEKETLLKRMGECA